MPRKTPRNAVQVKFRAPPKFIEQFDKAIRRRGHTNRGEAIRAAMQRYIEALRESQRTHTERVDR